MKEKTRFLQGRDGSIYDSVTSLTWMGTDSRLDLGKNINWYEVNAYAESVNKKKVAGYNDWRMPTIHEALSLYEEEKLNKDFNNGDIHIDAIFPAGSGNCTWTSHTRGKDDAQIVFYLNGCPYWYEKHDQTISHAVRLVRKGL